MEKLGQIPRSSRRAGGVEEVVVAVVVAAVVGIVGAKTKPGGGSRATTVITQVLNSATHHTTQRTVRIHHFVVDFGAGFHTVMLCGIACYALSCTPTTQNAIVYTFL